MQSAAINCGMHGLRAIEERNDGCHCGGYHPQQSQHKDQDRNPPRHKAQIRMWCQAPCNGDRKQNHQEDRID
ncbi:hypothetical protein D7T48_08985 [Stenotrophomonas maltophilia]|nr:hypothetical protein [Stenotrophomonas maltophilia]MBA0411999.1 hypothetical protein [Stenotrophomonas maltophilia]MBA0497674.1 hypothetical protein [Stenotrophomonas maltophilia]MBA0502217.1 hypothetical protein [Stenotrophomonas maltophilia]MBA0506461.1 hypothetical protein [Stenotrophomonas maltophilia]